MMLCYFPLVNGTAVIRDETGCLVADVDQARLEALRAISEMRESDPRLTAECAGWTLQAVDASEAILFTIPLDSRLHT
jgi:hypothetical protein